MNLGWCPICCTRHLKGQECPGELLATGAERYGWRASFETPGDIEVYGALVAPAGRLWRARILTYPNTLWAIPGDGGPMKFVGGTPQAAERQAIAFIEEHCAERGYQRLEGIPVPGTVEVDPEEAPGLSQSAREHPPRRKLRSLPVRWGHKTTTREAVTLELSEAGLFVVTRSPLEPGAVVRLQLELDTSTVPLRGMVAWIRERAKPGRPAGMGIRLSQTPDLYLHYVKQLH